MQPVAFAATPAQPGHLGRRAGFVNEHKFVLLPAHDGLVGIFPFGPCGSDIKPVLFGCPQCFF